MSSKFLYCLWLVGKWEQVPDGIGGIRIGCVLHLQAAKLVLTFLNFEGSWIGIRGCFIHAA
jgi:hypothetical protein